MEYIHVTWSSCGWNAKNDRHRFPVFKKSKQLLVTSTDSCFLKGLSKTEAGYLDKYCQLLFSLQFRRTLLSQTHPEQISMCPPLILKEGCGSMFESEKNE